MIRRCLTAFLFVLTASSLAQAQITVHAVNQGNSGATGSPYTTTLPTISNNDVAVICPSIGAALSDTLSCPAGYTQAGATIEGGTTIQSIACLHLWKTGDTTSPSVSFVSGFPSASFVTMSLSGAAGITLDGTPTTATGTTSAANGAVTTTVANAALIQCVGYQIGGGGGTITSITFTSPLTQQEITSGSGNTVGGVGEGILVTAGSSGTITATVAPSGSIATGILFAIDPPVTGPQSHGFFVPGD